MNKTKHEELLEWAQGVFTEGCYLGDLARSDPKEMTEEETFNLECAREGWLANGSQHPQSEEGGAQA